MLRKVIGAALGAKLAKSSPAVGGAAGTVIATAVPFVLSRVALPGLAMIGAGALAFNYYRKHRDGTGHGTGRAGEQGHEGTPRPSAKPETVPYVSSANPDAH
ncbi:hypothetical protein J3454_08265 [Erythrobacter sp. NFXS35]|uniref:hypothetical protein n=1 Tax=Erythrobacter sp. NFXS35 TaxID=2818436 RepID=UPI0032DE775D